MSSVLYWQKQRNLASILSLLSKFSERILLSHFRSRFMREITSKIVKVLSLFFSFSTLLCCALPAFLGLVGFGAAMAGLISIFPFLITLSKIKGWLFLLGFILLGINGYYVFFKMRTSCPLPVSPKHKAHTTGCDIAFGWNKIAFWISATMLLVGFVMAYLAFPLLKALNVI